MTWASRPVARQTLLDRLGEPGGDHDVRDTASAGVLRSDVLEHDQAGGDVFELLADLLADRLAGVAAIGTGTLFDRHVMHDPLAGQARRQGFAAVTVGLGLRRGLGCLRRGSHRLGPGQDVVREEGQLVGIDLLPLLAVALPQELLELMLELGDEVILLTKGLGQFADLAVGGIEIIRQSSVARHTLYYGNA